MSELVFVEQSPDQGKRHVLHDGATIGREGCDVTLLDSEVSRRQARVTRAGGTAVIEDLGSTNGTFVNGERIAGPQTLGDGDEVGFGNTVWRFEAAAEPRHEPAPPPSQPSEVQPSVIRRAAPAAAAPAAFTPAGSKRPKRSAATRLSATVSATIVVALTWAGVVLYYVTEPFK